MCPPFPAHGGDDHFVGLIIYDQEIIVYKYAVLHELTQRGRKAAIDRWSKRTGRVKMFVYDRNLFVNVPVPYLGIP